MNTTIPSTDATNQPQEATIDGLLVKDVAKLYPEFTSLCDRYVAIVTEESELRTKLNGKVGARQEFETILKDYLDKYRANGAN